MTVGTGNGYLYLTRPASGTSTTAWEAVAKTSGNNQNLGVTAYAVCTQ
jgi:hypothetical protein